MKARLKAEELVSMYWNTKVETPHVRESIASKELAKQCALIAVYEIIKSNPHKFYTQVSSTISYWQEVKQEIKKL